MAGGVIIYTAATAIAAVVAVRAARANPLEADLGKAGALVAGFFLLSFAWGLFWPRPWSMAVYPLLDGTLLTWVAASFWRQYRVWKFGLGLLVLFQLIAHVPYWGITSSGFGSETLDLQYLILLNSAYAGQLAVLTGAGLLDGFRRFRLGRRLRNRAGGVHPGPVGSPAPGVAKSG